MKTFLLCLAYAIALLAPSPARASAVFHEITPEKLNDGGFIFEVTREHLAGGKTSFSVVMTEDTAKLIDVSSPCLCTTEFTPRSSRFRGGQDLVPERNEHSLVCKFTVEDAALTDRNFCFLISKPAESVLVNGKPFRFPYKDFFIVRLLDFAR